MTDFYSQNRCVCSTRSHGPLLCAFCLSFHFKPGRPKKHVGLYTVFQLGWEKGRVQEKLGAIWRANNQNLGTI